MKAGRLFLAAGVLGVAVWLGAHVTPAKAQVSTGLCLARQPACLGPDEPRMPVSLQAHPAPPPAKPGADFISGVVRSAHGPEAGVWVIARTRDLSTTFTKIVVTDARGAYLLPQLPRARYEVWVRGYGLVDSRPVTAVPGQTLDLAATIAPDARAAAQYYPADYWYSLAKVPPASAFPMAIGAPLPGAGDLGAAFGPGAQTQITGQDDWIDAMKTTCEVCHQMGDRATREIPSQFAVLGSSVAQWARRMESGQVGGQMGNALRRLAGVRGLQMFADWTDRIAAGAVPPAPPRPQGVERNLVITLWDWDTPASFDHDVISTDKLQPTLNAYGPVYGSEWSAGSLNVADPKSNTVSMIKFPLVNENDWKRLRPWTPQTVPAPSPYWGDQIVWDDPINMHTPQMDADGRIWTNGVNHGPDSPAFCQASSGNPFAKAYPIDSDNGWGVDMYDPKTEELDLIPLCYRTQHTIVSGDKDGTIYFAIPTQKGGIGWIKTRVWEQTHDAARSQGWCAPIVDGQWVPNAGGYGVAVDPTDGSVWYAAPGPPLPGKIIRIVPGDDPPASCRTEAYEPPFHNAAVPGVNGYTPRGIDVDSNGVVWTALAGSGDLASFDRRKCQVRSGAGALSEQQCPQAWTLYRPPGPSFQGETQAIVDWFYLNWTDRYDTLGLGKDAQVVCGTGADELLVYLPATRKWVRLRVPYPLGFYTRGLDGRIDDPGAGWKGRGLWAANETRVIWHQEGGKGSTSELAHFQLRPSPLAN